MILGAAARRMPVVLDGFIAGSAALVAVKSCPPARDYLIAGHISWSAAIGSLLDALGLSPLLNLDLRLGEGTGAALAWASSMGRWRRTDQMATFAEAGRQPSATRSRDEG